MSRLGHSLQRELTAAGRDRSAPHPMACRCRGVRRSSHSIRAVLAIQESSDRVCRATAQEVAALIRRSREGLGLTQHELALRMGSQQATVARWETGEHEITFRNLSRIAQALGVEFLVRFGQERDIA